VWAGCTTVQIKGEHELTSFTQNRKFTTQNSAKNTSMSWLWWLVVSHITAIGCTKVVWRSSWLALRIIAEINCITILKVSVRRLASCAAVHMSSSVSWLALRRTYRTRFHNSATGERAWADKLHTDEQNSAAARQCKTKGKKSVDWLWWATSSTYYSGDA
jgi:hypothetical protein